MTAPKEGDRVVLRGTVVVVSPEGSPSWVLVRLDGDESTKGHTVACWWANATADPKEDA